MSPAGKPWVRVVEDMAAPAGQLIVRMIDHHVIASGRCRLAVSGGTTPGPVFAWLSRNLPSELYRGLWLTVVDERYPSASNLAMVRERWLDPAALRGLEPAAVLPMVREQPGDLEAERALYAAALADEWDGGVDVALLGAGPDGHIASLFPGHPTEEDDGLAVAVRGSPKPPPNRISLTRHVLEEAPHVLLLARGAGKAAVLARARHGDHDTPLGRLHPWGFYEWMLDSAAASRLKKPEIA